VLRVVSDVLYINASKSCHLNSKPSCLRLLVETELQYDTVITCLFRVPELFSTLVHPTTTVRYINNSTIILTICQDHGRSIGRPCSYVLNELKQRRRSGTRIDDLGRAPEIENTLNSRRGQSRGCR